MSKLRFYPGTMYFLPTGQKFIYVCSAKAKGMAFGWVWEWKHTHWEQEWRIVKKSDLRKSANG